MRSALAFLTIVGRATAPTVGALLWFPVIGALLGLAVGGIWVGAGHAWPAVVVAAVVVAFDALLTGGLHWDGLADTGDGLLPALPVERRLAVMADPRIGAFGALTIAVTMLLRFVALAAGPARAFVVASLWCASRASVAVVALLGRYARADGIASGFTAGVESPRRLAAVIAVLGVAISVALAVICRPGHGLAALGAELVTIVALTGFSARRLGGYTGDVLGAEIVIGETVGLLLWCAQW